MADSEQFECVVCEHCLSQAESAGQLIASALTGSLVEQGFDCQQCGLPLIDGETYRVILCP